MAYPLLREKLLNIPDGQKKGERSKQGIRKSSQKSSFVLASECFKEVFFQDLYDDSMALNKKS